MADLEQNARLKAAGKKEIVISPIAIEIVRRIDALFEIERSINGQSAEERRAVRQELSAPLVANLESYMLEQRAKLSRGNDLFKAMNYLLKRWAAFNPVPPGRAGLPLKQCRRARAARYLSGQKVMALLWIRSRGTAGGGDVQPDHHGENERR
jgi:hypothetical protein